MDEQRIQAYVNLIEQLLGCTSREELTEVLQQHANLVDAKLLVVMQQYAAHLDSQDNSNAAKWLLRMGEQLAEAMGINDFREEEEELSEDSEQFLLVLLRLIKENQGNAEQVYPFLEQHQDKLNEQLLQTLPKVATSLMGRKSHMQENLVSIGTLGNLIAVFPSGQPWLNLELAIIAYEIVMKVYTREAFPENWAIIQNNLAIVYRDRIRGKKVNNLKLAFTAYKRALKVYTYETFPEQWAMTQNNLATVYRNCIRGEKVNNIELAITACERALKVYTREAFPEQWAMVQDNMANAYSSHIRGDRSNNLELAIAAYKSILEVRTREAFPEQWATTQNNLANAYSNRIRGDRSNNLELAITAYEYALEVITPEDFPQQCLITARSLGDIQFNQRKWEKATIAYAKALEAGEILYQSAILLDGKAAEIAKIDDLPRNAAYALTRIGDLEAALVIVERACVRGLSEILDRDRADLTELHQIDSSLYTKYTDITIQLQDFETQQRLWMTSNDRYKLTPSAISIQAQQLHTDRTEIIDRNN